MNLKKSFEVMSKPLVVGSTLVGSVGFALILTFADPAVVRSRLGISEPSQSAGVQPTAGTNTLMSTQAPNLAVAAVKGQINSKD